MAFDGAYGQSQSRGNCVVGQSLTDQHHDLAFAIGQRQGLAGLTKRRGAGAAALFGQGICACRAPQCRSAQVVAAIRDGGVRGRVHRGDEVAHALEVLGHRSQFSGVVITQGLGEPGGKADAWPLDDRFELAQPGCARTVPELGGGLQADHFGRELPH